jgi:hypothetical protein
VAGERAPSLLQAASKLTNGVAARRARLRSNKRRRGSGRFSKRRSPFSDRFSGSSASRARSGEQCQHRQVSKACTKAPN